MISAKIVADSINNNGNRITTYELEYPRFIHAEFMTHRLFSRNAASSRAIPVERSIELIRENTAKPIHWGKNQPGMSAKEENNVLMSNSWFPETNTERNAVGLVSRNEAWNIGRDLAIEVAEAFARAGYHKQIVNRLTEPYAHIKVVCTATEFDNFFYLRCHKDAQPEIQELANQMYDARRLSVPKLLLPGSWHVPYYKDGFFDDASGDFSTEALYDAIAVSASCCAQVSYRRLDDTIEKALVIYKRLMESKPAHASPFEHQATPMQEVHFCDDEQVLLVVHPDAGTLDCNGITHFDRKGDAWSGNFKGWIQNRQLIDDNYCSEFKP